MDLSRFDIDRELAAATAADSSFFSVFFEKLLSGLFENGENLSVRTDLAGEKARKVFIFPLLYWIARSGADPERGKALFLAPDADEARLAYEYAASISGALSERFGVCLAADGTCPEEGTGEARLVVATMQGLIDASAAGKLNPRQFGFVGVLGAETIAEMPGDLVRKAQGLLLPSWERRSLIIAGKNTPRGKNFAWDFADNPKEMRLAEAIGYAGSLRADSFDIEEKDKIRFVLSLARNEPDARICVFCNLKSTATELSKRLEINGVATDYIVGNLALDRKKQIVAKALEKAFVLVLTDEGSKGIEKACFPVVVNHDIPLEPEVYTERLSFLDRESGSAKLCNLVCERYMFGIPAIERLIDASLNVRPLDAAVELPEDKSAGMVIEIAPRLPRGRYDRRAPGHEGREGGERGESRERREGGEREAGGHGSGSGREGPRGAPRREEANRGGKPRAPEARQEGRGRQKESREGASPDAAALYAMSMEERLAMYRKKYGQAFSAGTQEAAGGKQAKGGKSQGRKSGRPQKKSSTDASIPGKEGEKPAGTASAGTPVPAASPKAIPEEGKQPPAPIRETEPKKPESPAAGGNAGETSRPADTGKPQGFLDRLQGLFGGKKD